MLSDLGKWSKKWSLHQPLKLATKFACSQYRSRYNEGRQVRQHCWSSIATVRKKISQLLGDEQQSHIAPDMLAGLSGWKTSRSVPWKQADGIWKTEPIGFGPYADLKAHQCELNWAAFVSYVTLIPLKRRTKMNDITIKEVNDYGAFKIWILLRNCLRIWPPPVHPQLKLGFCRRSKQN